MSSIYREQLEEWLGGVRIPAMSNVLDIGGSQLPVKDRLRHKGDGSSFTILDLEVPHKGQKPDIFYNINKYYSFDHNNPYDSYDIVFCLEVMEYIWNPVQALQNVRMFTNKGGILYITFPFVYPQHNPKGEDCLRYTYWGTKKLLEANDFRIEEVIPRTAQGLHEFYKSQRMRPADDVNHNDVGYIIKAIAI